MLKLSQRIIQLALLGACLLCGISSARAQTTIFNVPTADVQSSGKIYLEGDFITHFASYKDGGYQTYVPRVVVGLPGNTEVGVNFIFTKASPAEPVEVQPNFKWRFYANEKRGLSAAAGVLITIPITRRQEGRTTGMFYVVGSKAFPSDYGPTFTFGGYGLAGPFDEGTTRSGLIAGYEQPLTKKISFVTDWFSGKNDYGYVTPGVGINFTSKTSLYTGYSIGNEGRGNNFLGVYYGYSF